MEGGREERGQSNNVNASLLKEKKKQHKETRLLRLTKLEYHKHSQTRKSPFGDSQQRRSWQRHGQTLASITPQPARTRSSPAHTARRDRRPASATSGIPRPSRPQHPSFNILLLYSRRLSLRTRDPRHPSSAPERASSRPTVPPAPGFLSVRFTLRVRVRCRGVSFLPLLAAMALLLPRECRA